MAEENVYQITIPFLNDSTKSTIYGKGKVYPEEMDNTVSSLAGDMYFKSELVRNNKDIKHNTDGILVGKVHFQVTGKDNNESDGWITVDKQEAWRGLFQSVYLIFWCSQEFFNRMQLASQNKNEITVVIHAIEWKQDETSGDDFSARCRCNIVELEILPPNSTELSWFENRRVKEIENYLLAECCGHSSSGQIGAICKEIATSFADQANFNNRNELIEPIIELIGNLKSTLDPAKSELRIEIESGSDAELARIFDLTGSAFDEQLKKVNDKIQYKLRAEYNHLWSSSDAFKIFDDGYKWSSGDISSLADDYLKIKSINSPTLNRILLEALIGADIAETSHNFQYSDKMSASAILTVRDGMYDKSKVKEKGMSFKGRLLVLVAESAGWWIGVILRGLIVWFVTSLLAENNATGQYILFGTIFSAWIIIDTLNFNLAKVEKEDTKEEFYFYVLRDLCALHYQSKFMDTKLLRHRLYKLENQGVKMNSYIYGILNRVD